ncbi:hypothetical protein [Devosia sp.]|uniref:hypothetical protein n=1 Tax=Devosia sp. TaxID=1871048 RepID=UPI003A942131
MAEACDLLGINLNTFKTRLKRGQALARRMPGDTGRVTLGFTGFQLVHNLLSDRLLRYGFAAAPYDPDSTARAPHVHAEWVFDTVLCPPRHLGAVLEFRRYADGTVVALGHDSLDPLPMASDGALVLPIGRMVTQLAEALPMEAADYSGAMAAM